MNAEAIRPLPVTQTRAPIKDQDEARLWFAFALPAMMAVLLALVPLIGKSAAVPMLLVLVPLALWAAFRDTERAIYVYIAWCWMDGTIRGICGANPIIVLARDLLLLIIATGWLLQRSRRTSANPIRIPPGVLLITLFVINAVLQIGNPTSGGLVQSLGGLKMHLLSIPLLFIGYDVFRRRGQIRSLFVFLTLATLVVGGVSYVQYAHGRDWTWSHFPGTEKVISQNFNPSINMHLTKDDIFKPPGTTNFGGGTGGIVGAVFPLTFALLLLSNRMGFGKYGKAAFAAIVMAFIVIIFINGLRSAIVDAIVGALLCGLLTGGRMRLRSLIAVAVCLSLGMAAWTFSQNFSHGGVTDRFGSLFNDPNAALHSDRQSFFDHALETIANSPVGCGLGRHGAAAGYLDDGSSNTLGFSIFCEDYLGLMIYETGILGALLILGIAVTFLSKGWQILRRIQTADDKVLAAALLTVLLLIFQGFFNSPVLLGPPGSVFFWLFSAILLRVYEKPAGVPAQIKRGYP